MPVSPAVSNNPSDPFNLNAFNSVFPVNNNFSPAPVAGDLNLTTGDTSAPTFGDSLFGDGTAANPGYLIPGLQALGGITNAYTGYKSLGLAKDQFNRGKQEYNRDLANQTQTYNTQLENAHRANLAYQGIDPNSPEFAAALKTYVDQNSVNGAPIG